MNIPTYQELYQSVLTDLRNRLGINFIIGKVVLNAFAAVYAAKLKIQYVSQAFIYKNIFVDTADPEALGGSLERYGLVKLGRRPFAAVAGEYIIQVTGVNGATIAQNTTFKSLEGSLNPDKLFILDSAFVFTSGTGSITIRALDLGPDAALEIGNDLQVTAPIANVDSFAEVLSVSTTPTAQESYDDYRIAVINSYQLESQGGARTDYRLWAQDAAGVREVYPYVKENYAGEINLYIEANVADSSDGKGTPTQSILDEVEEVVEFDPDTTKPLNERGRRPMSVFDIHFLAISPLVVDVEIIGLTDTSFVTAIESALETFLFTVRPFIAGADNPNNEQQDKLFVSDIFTIVRGIIGSNNTFTSIIMEVAGSPETIYQFLNGDIPYLGTVIAV